jgi:hypothetical protein
MRIAITRACGGWALQHPSRTAGNRGFAQRGTGTQIGVLEAVCLR